MKSNNFIYQYIVKPTFLLFVSFFILSGCAIGPIPPCPIIRIDTNTASLSEFIASESLDETENLAYKAEIYTFDGTCQFDDEGVEVTMNLDLLFNKGPAIALGEVDLLYFISIPRFYPNDFAKKIFNRKHIVKANDSAVSKLSEKNIKVFIPLDDNMTAAAYDIYIGFQLNDAQLKYNLNK